VLSGSGPFYSLPSSFLTGPAAAGGIALVNSIANFGGFLGPYLVGILKERTGGYTAAYAALATFLIFAAILVVMVGRRMPSREPVSQTVG